jgi:hypothetical protein
MSVSSVRESASKQRLDLDDVTAVPAVVLADGVFIGGFEHAVDAFAIRAVVQLDLPNAEFVDFAAFGVLAELGDSFR